MNGKVCLLTFFAFASVANAAVNKLAGNAWTNSEWISVVFSSWADEIRIERSRRCQGSAPCWKAAPVLQDCRRRSRRRWRTTRTPCVRLSRRFWGMAFTGVIW